VFTIKAMICFVGMGIMEQTLCFQSEVPLEFDKLPICVLEMNKLANYMGPDLEDRNVAIVLNCVKDNNIKL
jgi:hypothetical protein|tara:strand:+ start:1570 stop:1782 length:213 start_codon:yes stop_codon:yes gene_type:complete